MEKESCVNLIQEDPSWSFSDLSKKETNYASHGYHKYPAKFIPSLVKKLLIEYSKKGETVLDPFGGCGTTLVESKINQRNSVCIDLNDSALLISSAKKTAINPEILEKGNKNLFDRIERSKISSKDYSRANERLKYWFDKIQFNKLMKIFNAIQSEQNKKLKVFYNCCFSNILKNCSIWYSKSIKPMRDLNKKQVEPLNIFKRHLDFMTRQNLEYYLLLKDSRGRTVKSMVKKADARKTGLKSESIDLIITSPPYATSYEYVDIHQLSLLWFGFAENLQEIKKDYIGTSSKKTIPEIISSDIAKKMIKQLENFNHGLALQISNYVLDLEKSFLEMHRVLKPKKRLCVIIGDTEYKGVKILNTEVSLELLSKIGFKIEKVIKRRLSSKTFTPFRDKEGKFSKNKRGKKVYQHEYIIIARK